RDDPVLVGTDAEAVAGLPEVHRAVLVPEDRLLHFVGPGGQPGDRCGDGVLVGQWLHRHRHPGHPADLGTPDARAADHRVHGEISSAGAHFLDSAAAEVETGDFGAPQVADPALAGSGCQRGGGPDRFGGPVAGHVPAAVDPGRFYLREELVDLFRGDQFTVDAPAGGKTVLALQVVPALLGGGHLDAAHPVVAGA